MPNFVFTWAAAVCEALKGALEWKVTGRILSKNGRLLFFLFSTTLNYSKNLFRVLILFTDLLHLTICTKIRREESEQQPLHTPYTNSAQQASIHEGEW